MFVAVELSHTPFPFAKKKRLYQIDVPGGTPFCVIRCPMGGKVPWRKIARLAGEQGGHLLLLPEGIHPPAGEELEELFLDGFYDTLNYCTLLKFLTLLRPYRRTLRLGVVDVEGRLAQESARLLRCARNVCVFTDAADEYEEFREEAMAETGAALLVSGEMAALRGCSLVLAPFGTPENLPLSRGAYLYGFAPVEGARLLRPSGFVLPNELEALCPQGIRPLDFAGALSEKCGLRALARQGYGEFMLENKKISLAQGARLAQELDTGSRIHYN